jgi:hypothetical protein
MNLTCPTVAYENGLIIGGTDGNLVIYSRKATKENLHADQPYQLVKKIRLTKQDGGFCGTIRNLSTSSSGDSVAITLGTNIGLFDLAAVGK